MPDRARRIAERLTSTFAPARLQVEDDSARHAGHAGAAAGGETHYTVTLVSAAFAGLSRIDRQRRVNAALAEEFADGLHALRLVLKSPGEDGAA